MQVTTAVKTSLGACRSGNPGARADLARIVTPDRADG